MLSRNSKWSSFLHNAKWRCTFITKVSLVPIDSLVLCILADVIIPTCDSIFGAPNISTRILPCAMNMHMVNNAHAQPQAFSSFLYKNKCDHYASEHSIHIYTAERHKWTKGISRPNSTCTVWCCHAYLKGAFWFLFMIHKQIPILTSLFNKLWAQIRTRHFFQTEHTVNENLQFPSFWIASSAGVI